MSPAAIEALIILAAKYGPELVNSLIGIFRKQNATLEDIEALFANVKPYEAYDIPAPTPALPPAATPTPTLPPGGSALAPGLA